MHCLPFMLNSVTEVLCKEMFTCFLSHLFLYFKKLYKSILAWELRCVAMKYEWDNFCIVQQRGFRRSQISWHSDCKRVSSRFDVLVSSKRCFYFIASALHFKHDYLKNILLVICIQNIISWALNFLAAKTSQQVDTDIVWLAYILGAFINIYYFILL